MYIESDLVRIAKRENNKKRNYLVVNLLQGKHIPVSPKRAIEVFSELAGLLEKYKEEKLLVVGFAETATAIGTQVAIELGANYIQTTREEIPDVDYLFFSEEHSHAMEQKLVKDDLDEIIDKIDRIIFVEDEVTTGKTIWNLITVIEQCYGGKKQFAVASLLNGMSKEAEEAFSGRGIKIHYLVKIRHDRYPDLADKAVEDGIYYQEKFSEEEYTACFDAEGWMDTRRIVDIKQYEDACRRLSEDIIRQFPLENFNRILVLGTEEFMFPGLYVGKCVEEKGYFVRFHATTRSPIIVSSNPEYPLHERYALSSMYGEERKIFVYDIDSYDAVFVITDAQKKGNQRRKGELLLLNAVRGKFEKRKDTNAELMSSKEEKGYRNEIVYFVRWV